MRLLGSALVLRSYSNNREPSGHPGAMFPAWGIESVSVNTQKGRSPSRTPALPRRYAVDSTQQSTSMSGYPVHRSIPPTQGTVPTLFCFPNILSSKPYKPKPIQNLCA